MRRTRKVTTSRAVTPLDMAADTTASMATGMITVVSVTPVARRAVCRLPAKGPAHLCPHGVLVLRKTRIGFKHFHDDGVRHRATMQR